MAEPKSTSRHLAEPMPYYYVDSWEALDSLPIAHTRGPFVISPVQSQALSLPSADEAFRQELARRAHANRHLWREELASEGGTLTGQQMADILGISRQAVYKRRNAGTLLAVRDAGRSYVYPAWQLRDGQLLPGLERALAALRAGEHGERDQLVFFLTTFPRLWDKRPLDVLRQGTEHDIDEVEGAALGYLEQGCA